MRIGISAYILNLNGILPDDSVLDAGTLPKVRMPNRDGFTPDVRPDVPNAANVGSVPCSS